MPKVDPEADDHGDERLGDDVQVADGEDGEAEGADDAHRQDAEGDEGPRPLPVAGEEEGGDEDEGEAPGERAVPGAGGDLVVAQDGLSGEADLDAGVVLPGLVDDGAELGDGGAVGAGPLELFAPGWAVTKSVRPPSMPGYSFSAISRVMSLQLALGGLGGDGSLGGLLGGLLRGLRPLPRLAGLGPGLVLDGVGELVEHVGEAVDERLELDPVRFFPRYLSSNIASAWSSIELRSRRTCDFFICSA